jgi:hypothetical protein
VVQSLSERGPFNMSNNGEAKSGKPAEGGDSEDSLEKEL